MLDARVRPPPGFQFYAAGKADLAAPCECNESLNSACLKLAAVSRVTRTYFNNSNPH